ncbi:hypothetical protein EV361DRAFT_785437, partial [Lentinula raphanica]
LSIKPHAWVINETKSSSPVLSRLRTNSYKTFESVGIPQNSRRGPSKWGVGMGIQSTFQCQQIPTHDELQGRAIAVDIVIPTTSGRGNTDLVTFWNHITDLCQTAPHSWSFIGDCNLTLDAHESSGADRNGTRRELYNQCLDRARGVDIWTLQGNADVRQFSTFENHAGRSIIDRCSHSNLGVLESSIEGLGRFMYPQKTDKHLFLDFASKVDTKCRQADLQSSPLTDDKDFEHRYLCLTDILGEAASETFQRRQLYRDTQQRKVINPRIRLILRECHRINRLIYATNHNKSINERWVSDYYSSFLHDTPSFLPPPNPPLRELFLLYLKQSRRSLSRLRYQEEKAELKLRSTSSARSRINNVLLGGSVKRLYPWSGFNGPPRALFHSDNSSEIVTDPSQIKAATVQYFQNLYKREDHPLINKPWLETPSVLQIRNSTSADPFAWPTPMTLGDFRMILRKGKGRPAPGLDGWEKWMIKSLNDYSLQLVLDLANYIILKSHFPDVTKPSVLSTLFKRGSPMDLANYRGTCSGVQGRDLISFLAQVESWSNRTKTPIYALRRDQAKGFDRLEPEGFYDAIQAYGLPQSLIDFDRSAQADVP